MTIAAQVLETARQQGLMIATAESCTGGMVAAALTEIAGASAAVERGFVTYTNAAKREMLSKPKRSTTTARSARRWHGKWPKAH